MLNYLVSNNLRNKIKWYINAHSHSSVSALNLVLSFFEDTDHHDLTTIIRELTRMFENFGETNNFDNEIMILDANLKSVEFLISKMKLPVERRDEILTIILGIKKNIRLISGIIKDPTYSENFRLSKIVFSSVSKLVEKYPGILYGDLVGDEGPNTGNNLNIHFDHAGVDEEYSFCGYEIQLLITSLLSNSLEEMNKKGNIYLSLKTTKQRVKICVEDDGAQISDAEIRRIKQKKSLFMNKRNVKKKTLGVVFDVLEKYNGLIDVRRNDVNKTTAYVVDLPFKSV